MKRIIISQRRDKIAGRDEERDASDVRIGKMLFELGYVPIFLCSAIDDLPKYINALNPDAIMLGSGNDIGEHPDRDKLETYLLDYATENKTPLFAICRGTQMINHYMGGTLQPVNGHVATRVKITGELADKYGYDTVNTYHNFAINKETLNESLKVIAQTTDGIVKAIAHKELPWLGIMWHPEREPHLKEQDANLIKNLLN